MTCEKNSAKNVYSTHGKGARLVLAPFYFIGKGNGMREDMIQITKEMVEIPSINTTEGERHIGEYIEKFLREIPYFKKHPDRSSCRN